MSDTTLSAISLYIPTTQAPRMNALYSGINHHKRAKLAQEWHTIVCAIVYQEYPDLPAPFFSQPVMIAIEIRAARPCDPDNVSFAAKLLIDGLTHAGVLIDDSWKHVAEVRLRSGKPTLDRAAGVYVEVREAE